MRILVKRKVSDQERKMKMKNAVGNRGDAQFGRVARPPQRIVQPKAAPWA
jgi:hypothetical protein